MRTDCRTTRLGHSLSSALLFVSLLAASASLRAQEAAALAPPATATPGRYNPNALFKAKAYIDQMTSGPSAFLASDFAADGIDPAAAGAAWTDLGPGNLGGRVRSMAVHPGNPNILYLGSVAGGIWSSANAGGTWTPQNDFLPTLSVTTLIVDKNNPNNMFAGTGEFFTYQNDGTRGAGVFQSTNGGASWVRLASTTGSEWNYVNCLTMRPGNSQVLMAALNTGIQLSTDGGATWSTRLSGFVMNVKFNPTNPNLAIAAGFDGQAWFSTDGGNSWIPSSGLPVVGRVEVAYAPSHPDSVYAIIDDNNGDLYVSGNGGQSYSLRNTNHNLLAGLGFSAAVLWVDPLNSQALITGGDSLWRSTNGGLNFTDISVGAGIHNGAHQIVAAQDYSSANKRIYVVTDGGIYSSADYSQAGGAHPFTNLNHNLRITMFYGAAGNAASGLIAGGTQDEGFPRFNGFKSDGTLDNNAWRAMLLGDVGFTAVAPALQSDGSTVFFAERNGGNPFTVRVRLTATGGMKDTMALTPLPETGNIFYIPPMILDPNASGGTLYKGIRQLWRYKNAIAGPANGPWESIKPAAGPLSAIAVAPSNSNIVWVGDNNGQVFRTANATAATPTWQLLPSGATGSLPTRKVTRITIDPGNTNRAYICFGDIFDYETDNLWITEDNGSSFTNIGAALPAIPMRALAIDPLNTNKIYLGTELGLFASDNRGGSWTAATEGPAKVAVHDLSWMGHRLLAATHGRGMFTLGVAPAVALTSPGNNAAFTGGANISLAATASDADGSVSRVEFLVDNVKIGEDVAAPYTFTWKSVPIGAYKVAARAFDNDGNAGTSSAVNVAVTGGSITNRAPTADAYVRDGANAAVNFGTAATVQAKQALAGQVGNNRESYFKFSVSSLTGFASKIRLRVFGNLNNLTDVPQNPQGAAFAVPSTSWIESGSGSITWNTKPAIGAQLGSGPLLTQTNPPTNPRDWHEFDVTSYVRSQRNQGKTTVSLALRSLGVTDAFFSASSRENAATAERPQLAFSLIRPSALLVVGNAALVAGDAAISNRLKAIGFTVTVKDAASSLTTDANGKALVLISATVTSSAVNAKFRNVAVPVVNAEEALQDDFGMTANVTGTDRGTQPGATSIAMQTIQDANSPLAAGLSGTQTVTSSAGTLSWGIPSTSAIRLAKLSGTNFYGEYAYEKDAPMVGMSAPARRVHIFLTDATPTILTTNGWLLFDAAVIWAAGL